MIFIYIIIASVIILIIANRKEIVRDKSIPTYKLKETNDGITLHFWDVEKKRWLSPIKRKLIYNMFGDVNIDYYNLTKIEYKNEYDIKNAIDKYSNNIKLLRQDIKKVKIQHKEYYEEIDNRKKQRQLEEAKEYAEAQEKYKKLKKKYTK